MISTPANELPAFRPRRGLAAVLEHVDASHWRAVAFLLLACAVSFLPGFFNIPPIDRDEARFVQATRQMIETGDYVDIRFQDEVRYKKPVGIYWLQAAAVRTAEALGASDPRTSLWLYRLPSLLGAIGAVLLTYWTALAFDTRRGAYLAALMMACCVLLGAEARLATTDAALLLTIVAAMGALAHLYLDRRLRRDRPDFESLFGEPRPPAAPEEMDGASRTGWLLPAVFWTALAGGILLKGPLILMIVGLAVVTLAWFDRSLGWLRSLRPAIGIPWVLLLVLPWFVAILHRTGSSFLVQSLGEDLLAKVIGGQETHGAPPGSYLALFWLSFWPAAPLAVLAASAVWRDRRDAPTRFLLAWLVPSWIVFEIVVTKLPHYVLPLYPAIAILIARQLDRETLSQNRRLLPVTAWWPLLAIVLPLAGVISVMILRQQLALLAWPFGAVAVIYGVLAWWLYDTDGPALSLMRAAIAGQLVSVSLLGASVPLMRPLFPSAALAYTIGIDCQQPQFAAAGYHEPSLVFLFGTSTRLTDGQGAADFLGEGPCRFAFVEARQERAFVQRADATGVRYASGPRVDGVNYSAGRGVSIAIFRSEGTP